MLSGVEFRHSKHAMPPGFSRFYFLLKTESAESEWLTSDYQEAKNKIKYTSEAFFVFYNFEYVV